MSPEQEVASVLAEMLEARGVSIGGVLRWVLWGWRSSDRLDGVDRTWRRGVSGVATIRRRPVTDDVYVWNWEVRLSPDGSLTATNTGIEMDLADAMSEVDSRLSAFGFVLLKSNDPLPSKEWNEEA